MSFMLNPYPYDDPKAVNHIPMAEDFCSAVTQTTLDTAKKLVADASAVIAEKGKCVRKEHKTNRLEDGDYVAHNYKEAAFAYPYRELGILFGKRCPKFFDFLHISPPSWMLCTYYIT